MFGSFGILFLYCYLRPQARVARYFMDGPRYPRAMGRNAFALFATLCFIGCGAALLNLRTS